MNIIEKIRDYQKDRDSNKNSSIFLDLADQIIMDFPYRLKNKTYLLVPDKKKELREMSYEYFISTGKTIPISLTLKMSEIINRFEKTAEKLGFTIITSLNEYTNDGEFFDLMGTQSIIKEDYNNIPNVNFPITLSVNDFLKNIFFPVVFKNNTANRGEDKYLIENEEQLRKIIALFELPESKKINLKDEFIVQEYIKGFEGINSSIRVATTCTGDILTALFLVSTNETAQKKIKNFGIDVFNPCEYLNDPTSLYYLNSKNIISNTAAGGRVIPLNPELGNISVEDEIILNLHNIDTDSLQLPQTIIRQCQEITKFWSFEKGIILGIDFIYNSTNNNWYYLEANKNPSVRGYEKFMNLDNYLKKDIKTLMQLDALIRIVENIMTIEMQIENERRK